MPVIYSSHYSWLLPHFNGFRSITLLVCCLFDAISRLQWRFNNDKFAKLSGFGAKFCRKLIWPHKLCGHFNGLYNAACCFVFYKRTGEISFMVSRRNLIKLFLQNTAAEWKQIFLVGAAMYIGCAIVFIIFGSGQIQHWNEPKKSKEKKLAVEA